jgi:hypothetical protein
VTAWFIERFGRTIAIEPNASLRSELMRACPSAEVVGERILDAKVSAAGDLILCSHVFYYIDASEWMATLEQLVSWLSRGAILVLVVQNQDTDCMRMLEHFFGRRFLVPSLARRRSSRPLLGHFDFRATRTLFRYEELISRRVNVFLLIGIRT